MAQQRMRLNFTIRRTISRWRWLRHLIDGIRRCLMAILNRIRGVVGLKASGGGRTLMVCWLSGFTVMLLVYSLHFVRLFTQPVDQWGRVTSFILGVAYWVIIQYIIIRATETYGLWVGVTRLAEHAYGGGRKPHKPKLARLLDGVR